MIFTPSDSLSLVAFLLVVFCVCAAFVYGTYSANRRVGTNATHRAAYAGLGLLLWVGVLSLVVSRGALETRPFQVVIAFFVISNSVAVVTALSPIGQRLALGLPLFSLVGFHTFRLPLELILHRWVHGGTIPSTMTWTGSNFDVLTPVLAMAVFPFVNRIKILGWIFNGVGLLLLLNVMRVAVFSSPVPFGWKVDPPLQLAFHLPYALIVPVCVAGALGGHIVLTRALLLKKV